MTYLQLINKVLVGLREATVAAVPTTPHGVLVAQFVNEAKEDIEDLGPWLSLRSTVNVSLSNGVSTGALSGTNERSYLLYLPMLEGSMPQAFITTADYERRLNVLTLDHLASLQNLYPDADRACPEYVAFAPSATGLTAHFWPTPDATYNARFHVIIPQAELSSASTALTIPSRPVWQEALVRAMEERGEEFAGSIEGWRNRASRSLESAILADFGSQPMTFSAE